MTTSTATAEYTIRSATSADLDQIISLLEASSLPTTGVDAALGGFFVAESDGAIVGSVGLESCCNRFALLRSTAVREGWRSRGLGRRLVERAVAAAESRGIEALYLLTTTAERYFPSLGFTRVERDDTPASVRASEEFRSACPSSATVMTRPLTRAANSAGQ
jgi:N-acetylglutamate synthase-like GNAT family acetyltransferase